MQELEATNNGVFNATRERAVNLTPMKRTSLCDGADVGFCDVEYAAGDANMMANVAAVAKG